MRAIKLFIKRPPGANGENKSLFTLKLIQLVPSLSSSLSFPFLSLFESCICYFSKRSCWWTHLSTSPSPTRGSPDEPSTHLFNYQYFLTK